MFDNRVNHALAMWLLAAGFVCLAVLGAHPEPKPNTAGLALADSLPNWRIEGSRLGPFKMGMREAEVIRLARGQFVKATKRMVEREGDAYPEIVLSRANRRLAYLELADGKIWRMRVEVSGFATKEGARVGDSVRTLAKRFGSGQVGLGEGTVCVWFARKPGLSFCLAQAEKLFQPKLTWQKVVQANPRVGQILITGDAGKG